jgi:probable HAF family extracellular repeat protein
VTVTTSGHRALALLAAALPLLALAGGPAAAAPERPADRYTGLFQRFIEARGVPTAAERAALARAQAAAPPATTLKVRDIQPFDVPGSGGTAPQGINNKNEKDGICFGGICGAGYFEGASGFAYIGQSAQILNFPGPQGDPGTPTTGVLGTFLGSQNDSHHVVGWYDYYDATTDTRSTVCFTWTPQNGYSDAINTLFPAGSTEHYCDGNNNHGDVVGSYSDPNTGHLKGFLIHDNSFSPIVPGLANVSESEVFDINNNGAMVGYYVSGSGNTTQVHAFKYKDGQFTEITVPGEAFYAVAYGINDKGDIVGEVENFGGSDVAFVKPFGKTAISFHVPFANTDEQAATGISNGRKIVGIYDGNNGDDNGFDHGFTAELR